MDPTQALAGPPSNAAPEVGLDGLNGLPVPLNAWRVAISRNITGEIAHSQSEAGSYSRLSTAFETHLSLVQAFLINDIWEAGF